MFDMLQNETAYIIIRVSCIQAMKKLLIILAVGGMSSPAFADITHRMSSSLSLTTNAAATQVERIGSTYSVSGSGVSTDVGGGGSADLNVGGLGTLTDGVGQGSISTATHTAGTAFTFSQSFIEGDAISTTAPAVGAVSPYSSQVTNAVGSGTGSGTVTSGHALTAVGGGSGTVTIGQFVTELNIN
jgi:hypothetical protein